MKSLVPRKDKPEDDPDNSLAELLTSSSYHLHHRGVCSLRFSFARFFCPIGILRSAWPLLKQSTEFQPQGQLQVSWMYPMSLNSPQSGLLSLLP